jgi:hypothetical protein
MPEPTTTGRDADRLIYGGLLGLALAGSLQLVDQHIEESLPLTVACYAFAASLPLLAASLVAELVRHRQPRAEPGAMWRHVIGLISALVAVVGLAGLFFHFGNTPGLIFAVSALLAALIVRSL